MRTYLVDKHRYLDESVKDNRNVMVYYHDAIGRYYHSFSVASFERFNEQRKQDYEKDFVVDGDVICHKDWFTYDEFLGEAFDDCNENPMDITWDHRFYVVVRSYDGKSYAVNIRPQFYSPLVPGFEGEDPKQIIIPIKDITDDYVHALTGSFILRRFSECSDHVINENFDLIPSSVPRFAISEDKMIAIRALAFINSLRSKGFKKIVISFTGPGKKLISDQFKLNMYYVNENDLGFHFSYLGHYSECGDEEVILARDEIARQYEKNGYLLIDFNDMVNGKYVGVEFSKDNKFVREHK